MWHASLPLVVAVLLAGTTLHAQILLDGIVREAETRTPLDAVSIDVLDRSDRIITRAITDGDGLFTSRVPRDGAYRIRASRLGYESATTPVLYADGYDHLVVEVRLDAEAVLLAPLEVLARSNRALSPLLQGFAARSSIGLGHFITRDQIERRDPGLVTDMLATVPGVRLESSGSGMRRTVTMGRSGIGGMRPCPVQIFIDGRLLNRRLATGREADFAIDDVVSPEGVEGIEVYSGLSRIPAEFLNPNARCGVVAIWTRRG